MEMDWETVVLVCVALVTSPLWVPMALVAVLYLMAAVFFVIVAVACGVSYIAAKVWRWLP